MRFICLFMLVTLAAGCASSGSTLDSSRGDRASRTIRIATADGGVIETGVGEESGTIRTVIEAPPAEVWSQLPAAYRELGLEVNSGDSRSRVLGLENVRLRRIGNERPSRYLECGQGVTGPNADRFDVYFSMLAQVLGAAGGGSEVHVRIMSTARDGAHGGQGVSCGSNGRLENRLLQTLEELVKTPSQ